VTSNRRQRIALVPVGSEISASASWQYCCRAGWSTRHDSGKRSVHSLTSAKMHLSVNKIRLSNVLAR